MLEIEGIYRNGEIELAYIPEGIPDGTRVVVRFLDLEEPDDAEAKRKAAIERVKANMREGLDLGGPPYPTREEINEERVRRLEERRNRERD